MPQRILHQWQASGPHEYSYRSASFQCAVCDRKFATKSSLTQQQKVPKEPRTFKCQFCSQKFNSKYACAVHERRHTGNNPYVCDVPGCKRSYPQKIQLKLHIIELTQASECLNSIQSIKMNVRPLRNWKKSWSCIHVYDDHNKFVVDSSVIDSYVIGY